MDQSHRVMQSTDRPHEGRTAPIYQHPQAILEPSLLSFPPRPLTAATPYPPRNARQLGPYTVNPITPYLVGYPPGGPSRTSESYESYDHATSSKAYGSTSHLMPSFGSVQANQGFYVQPAFNRQYVDHPIRMNASGPFHSDRPSLGPSIRSQSSSNSTQSSFSFVKRMGTYRLSCDDSLMSAPDMSKYLGMELEAKPLVEVHDLINRLYPDEVLPFAITPAILSNPFMAPMWDKWKKSWRFDETYDERGFSEILNNIATMLSKISGEEPRRFWTAQLRDCSPEFSGRFRNDPPCQLKPDLVLVPNGAMVTGKDGTLFCGPIHWDIIRAVAEITKSKDMPARTKATINNKSFMLLITQPERIFVPFLTIYSSKPQRVQFRVTDREGQVACDFNLSQSGEIPALLLIRLVTALAFGGTRLHGRDPTISGDLPPGYTISAGDVSYCHAKLIHSSQSMTGRCTRVWSAEEPETNNRVIIKDGWVHQKRVSSEARYLKRLQEAGVSRVPTVLWEGIVGTEDEASTFTIRRGFSVEDDCRIHCRIVMTPYGEPLSAFKSLAELISALRDVASAHQGCIENDVLHRDISLDNIVLVAEGCKNRTGYLIDFDYASSCSSADGYGEQTGTLPFMAIEMLMKSPPRSSGNPDVVFCHSAKHDLESLFYVLLYICTFYYGPQAKIKSADLLKSHTSVPLMEWVDPSAFSRTFRSLGLLKLSHMANFETTILAKISAFFRPIIPGLITLHEKMFPPSGRYAQSFLDNQITHSKMIESFDEMIRAIDNHVADAHPRKKSRHGI